MNRLKIVIKSVAYEIGTKKTTCIITYQATYHKIPLDTPVSITATVECQEEDVYNRDYAKKLSRAIAELRAFKEVQHKYVRCFPLEDFPLSIFSSWEKIVECINNTNSFLQKCISRQHKYINACKAENNNAKHSYKDIKTFKDALAALNKTNAFLEFYSQDPYEDIDLSRSYNLFKLDVIQKALNQNYNLSLTKNNGNILFYPYITFSKDRIDSKEILGKIYDRDSDEIYHIINSEPIALPTNGIGCFNDSGSYGRVNANIALFGCATKDIATHFGRYFYKEIILALYNNIMVLQYE